MMQVITNDTLRFYDYQPQIESLYNAVINGLASRPRSIPPKFFYDERGSQLFAEICATPEYYPTRTEMKIIEQNIEEISHYLGHDCLLIEPGSGSSEKVRLLLDTVEPHTYMPMDISSDYLLAMATDLANDYPEVNVAAACVDYTEPLELPYSPGDIRRVAFFPGSSIGNFEPVAAITFLANIAHIVGRGGGLLIGVDLKKDPAILHAAYNDAQGLTADFNKNLLRRINHELNADFDTELFTHCAFYNTELGRIEMHLESSQAQTVEVADHCFRFARQERIHTENSYKYSLDEFRRLAQRAGFEPAKIWVDDDHLFSVQYLTVQ